MADPAPVAIFSPSAGLIVDRSEKSVIISGTMEMFGPEATVGVATTVQQTINQVWTKSFPDGHSIRCNVVVRYRPRGTPPAAGTQIEVLKTTGPSYTSAGLTTRSVTLNANNPNVFTWSAAHEFGHVLGLDDRYSEGIMSQIKGHLGGAREVAVNPGYEGNLMALHGGVLTSQNIVDLSVENAPSPYWINDDNFVADWVKAHPVKDIAQLSTTSKLRAIHTLSGGWVSDSDIEAISKICRAVKTPGEAATIRNGIDLLDFDVGQRAMVRVALAQMP